MEREQFHICQVNDADIKGGAEKISLKLHLAYQGYGYHSILLVGKKFYHYPNTIEIISNRNIKGNKFFNLIERSSPFRKNKFHFNFSRLIKSLYSYDSLCHLLKGMDDFDQPSIKNFLNAQSLKPDILHLHNLHGNYFRLAELPTISGEIPTFLTLHDMWPLTGSCTQPIFCQNWFNGCHNCDSYIVPSFYNRYGASRNWLYKKKIFEKSTLSIITPSQWLMNHTVKSILEPAIFDSRVIHNGIDLSIFHADEKEKARDILGLEKDSVILLFVATNAKKNLSKDFATLRKAIIRVKKRMPHKKILFIVLGDTGPSEIIDSLEIRFVPFIANERVLARYYQAADLYLHAAKADTFPNAVIEALACGTPVVATDVGGISEQVHDGHSGILVEMSDDEDFADNIEYLLENDQLREKMGINASNYAIQYFDFSKQVQKYIDYYEYIYKRIH